MRFGFTFLRHFFIDNIFIIAIISIMNANNSISNNINMIKKILSKTSWLIALAVGTLGIVSLLVWSQVASAQTTPVTFTSLAQSFVDDDNDTAVITDDYNGPEITVKLRAGSDYEFVNMDDDSSVNFGNFMVNSVESRGDCNEDDFWRW